MGLLPINKRFKWVYFIFSYIYVFTTYLITNHQTWREPHFLPLTPIDLAMPFLPWTGWIYICVYVFPLYVVIITKEAQDIKVVLTSVLSLASLCTLIFILYPTTYPRPLIIDGMKNDFALAFIRHLDTPNNCLPSQHVALAFLAAFIIRHFQKRAGNVAILIALAITISTLTTKQHYIWDVISGYILARLTFEFSKRRFHPNESAPPAPVTLLKVVL